MVSPAVIARGPGGFTPHSYRGVALDIDPALTSLLRFAYACEFANDSHYLATAAAINFGLHQRLTIEFAQQQRDPNSALAVGDWNSEQGLDRAYFTQWNQGTSASFAIASGRSNTEGRLVSILYAVAADPTGATNAVAIKTDSNTPTDYSHCVAVFDMSAAKPSRSTWMASPKAGLAAVCCPRKSSHRPP